MGWMMGRGERFSLSARPPSLAYLAWHGFSLTINAVEDIPVISSEGRWQRDEEKISMQECEKE